MDYRRFVNQVVVGVAVAVLVSANWADTIYVDDDNCPGPGSGTEADPYCSIQMAIDNAVDTDEIVVAPGTYLETINILGRAVWLHSSDGADVTIIDAQQAGTVVTCNSGEGPGTVLEGFTITGGSAAWAGGMLNDNASSPTVTDCTFTNNFAAFGGGMCNYDNSSPNVTNCTFSGNPAGTGDGGGMYNHQSSPTVTNCTFTDNSIEIGMGGGMCNMSSHPTVTNCTFEGNSASGFTGGYGGGMYNSSDSSPTVSNCTFSGNEAVYSGGGMYNDGGGLTVTESTFCGNVPNHWNGSLTLVGHTRMSDFCPIPVCPSDTDGNGVVDVVDFLALLANWGVCTW
jgi:hypothetical protein